MPSAPNRRRSLPEPVSISPGAGSPQIVCLHPCVLTPFTRRFATRKPDLASLTFDLERLTASGDSRGGHGWRPSSPPGPWRSGQPDSSRMADDAGHADAAYRALNRPASDVEASTRRQGTWLEGARRPVAAEPHRPPPAPPTSRSRARKSPDRFGRGTDGDECLAPLLSPD